MSIVLRATRAVVLLSCLLAVAPVLVAQKQARPAGAPQAPADAPADLPAAPEAAPPASVAPSDEAAEAAARAEFERGLAYRTGVVPLGDGIATLRLPATLRYLSAEDARKVLVDAWGNPPETAEGILGMVLPAALSPFDARGWAVVVEFSDEGHIKDDDAAEINYAELLRSMQKATTEENAERKKAGYGIVSLVGWAEPPHYDAATHKLYWAKELAFEEADGNTLNYSVRVLGRRGVLELNAVAGMDQLDQIRAAMPEVIAAADFNEGHRYADFDESSDKVAAYGIAALVAGAAASKGGLLKGLLIALVAGKKLVVGVAVAAAAWVANWWKGRREGSA